MRLFRLYTGLVLGSPCLLGVVLFAQPQAPATSAGGRGALPSTSASNFDESFARYVEQRRASRRQESEEEAFPMRGADVPPRVSDGPARGDSRFGVSRLVSATGAALSENESPPRGTSQSLAGRSRPPPSPVGGGRDFPGRFSPLGSDVDNNQGVPVYRTARDGNPAISNSNFWVDSLGSGSSSDRNNSFASMVNRYSPPPSRSSSGFGDRDIFSDRLGPAAPSSPFGGMMSNVTRYPFSSSNAMGALPSSPPLVVENGAAGPFGYPASDFSRASNARPISQSNRFSQDSAPSLPAQSRGSIYLPGNMSYSLPSSTPYGGRGNVDPRSGISAGIPLGSRPPFGSSPSPAEAVSRMSDVDSRRPQRSTALPFSGSSTIPSGAGYPPSYSQPRSSTYNGADSSPNSFDSRREAVGRSRPYQDTFGYPSATSVPSGFPSASNGVPSSARQSFTGSGYTPPTPQMTPAFPQRLPGVGQASVDRSPRSYSGSGSSGMSSGMSSPSSFTPSGFGSMSPQTGAPFSSAPSRGATYPESLERRYPTLSSGTGIGNGLSGSGIGVTPASGEMTGRGVSLGAGRISDFSGGALQAERSTSSSSTPSAIGPRFGPPGSASSSASPSGGSSLYRLQSSAPQGVASGFGRLQQQPVPFRPSSTASSSAQTQTRSGGGSGFGYSDSRFGSGDSFGSGGNFYGGTSGGGRADAPAFNTSPAGSQYPARASNGVASGTYGPQGQSFSSTASGSSSFPGGAGSAPFSYPSQFPGSPSAPAPSSRYSPSPAYPSSTYSSSGSPRPFSGSPRSGDSSYNPPSYRGNAMAA